MLDKQDLNKIEAMIDQKMDEKLERQKTDIMQEMDRRMDEKMERQKDEILQQAARNTQVIIENTVMKQLQLLIEGQQTLLEMMAPKSRVEALEEEVDVMKLAIRRISQDVAELKKAQ